MRKIGLIAALISVLVVAAAAPAVASDRPGYGPDRIVGSISIVADNVGAEEGTFTAKGSAVRRGLVCNGGTTEVGDSTVEIITLDPLKYRWTQERTFMCPEGSFKLRFKGVGHRNNPVNFAWRVVSDPEAADPLKVDGRGRGRVGPGGTGVLELYRGYVAGPRKS
jgi:hypothetical protein